MHNVQGVLALARVQALHLKRAVRVAVAVLLQIIKECFRFLNHVVRAMATASSLKTRVLHVVALALNVVRAK